MKAILIVVLPAKETQADEGIKSKASTTRYLEGWERIFGAKKEEPANAQLN